MVFEEIIRSSPRRRASPWLAEGFSPTARGAYRIKFSIPIISAYFSRRPKFISVAALVDRNSFRSPRGKRDGDCGRPRSVQPCSIGSTFVRTAMVATERGRPRARCPRSRDRSHRCSGRDVRASRPCRDAHRSRAPGTFQNNQGSPRRECFLSIKIWYDTDVAALRTGHVFMAGEALPTGCCL
jgi:hypothetical protein